MSAFDRYGWQTAVLADRRLRNASKVVASALVLVGDSDGVVNVGIPQLEALTGMSKRWVLAAMDELIRDAKAVRRRRRGFRGRHTAEYQLRSEYVHRSAPTPLDSVHPGAPSRAERVQPSAPTPLDSVQPSAPTPLDSVHSAASSRADYVHSGAPLLRRRREEEEEEEGQRFGVDEGDVVAALEALPAELRPDGHAEAAAAAQLIRARLARGWTVEAIADAASFRRSDRPIGNRVRVLEHRVPLAPPPARVLDLRRPSKPAEAPWCGQCDRASRRPVDEYGYVDMTQPTGSCAECASLAFAAHEAVR